MVDVPVGCGADARANALVSSLVGDENFDLTLPNFEGDDYKLPPKTGGLFDNVERLTNDDLTTRQVAGTGTFDALMQAFNVHLKKEYENNRITGEQYAKAYIALTEGAMANATSFLLGKDAAYWQAINAQIQAQRSQVELVTARVLLESQKTQLALVRFQALEAESNYALAKMRLATEDQQYCIAKYTLENILPLQKEQAEKEIVGINYRNLQTLEQTKSLVNENALHDTRKALLEGQVELQDSQIEAQSKQNEMIDKQIEKITEELKLIPFQIDTMKEQVEAARAQTLDSRSDGTPIAGQIGKQRDLYAQQIISYKRDGEMKAAKVFIDAWVTMKTIDEGLAPPTQFSNTNLDIILNTLKANNNLTTAPA